MSFSKSSLVKWKLETTNSLSELFQLIFCRQGCVLVSCIFKSGSLIVLYFDAAKSFVKQDVAPPFPTPDHYYFVREMRTVFSHGYTNSTLKSIKTFRYFHKENSNFNFTAGWDAEEWAHVCTKLGVLDINQTERVPIKFCNPLYGCNFAKCPYRDEDDQLPLFGLKTVQEEWNFDYEK